MVQKSGLFVVVAALFLFAGCGKRVQKPEEMSFAELKTKALHFIERKKHDNAIAHLEQLIAKYPEQQDVFEYKFMLADLYLKVGRLEEAHSMYQHYTKMYPSEARAESASYKALLSKFYQTLKVNKRCDDSDTQSTLKQCEFYLSNLLYTEHRKDVKDIQYTCERRLIDKEIYVFNSYLRRDQFQSALNRIEYLRETFLAKHPVLEAQLLYLEGKLAHKQNDGALAKKKVETLVSKYPESRFTKLAHHMVYANPRIIMF